METQAEDGHLPAVERDLYLYLYLYRVEEIYSANLDPELPASRIVVKYTSVV